MEKIQKKDLVEHLDIDETKINKVMESYKTLLEIVHYRRNHYDGKYSEQDRKRSDEILNPFEIEVVRSMTDEYINQEEYCDLETRWFLEILVDNSFKAGYNNFYFKENNIERFLTSMKGLKNNTLKIYIDNNNGKSIFSHGENIDVTINNNYSDCTGTGLETSKIKINNNYAKQLFEYCGRSTLTILNNDDKKTWIGNYGSYDCTIRSPDENVLEQTCSNRKRKGKLFLMTDEGDQKYIRSDEKRWYEKMKIVKIED